MVIGKRISSLLIWDDQGPPPASKHTLLWRSYCDTQNSSIESILKLVEDNALELRNIYLAWIYELGEIRFQGKKIVDHLELRPNLSFWWMTLLTEKCNFAKSPQIDDAIRLLAVEKWLGGREIGYLTIISSNPLLVGVIEKWCRENNIKFKHSKAKVNNAQVNSWRDAFFRKLPFSLQAVLWLLRKAWVSWALRGVGVEDWRASSAKITFISYLFNLVPKSAVEGRFQSRYWAHLPRQIEQGNMKTRWLHLWVRDELAPTAKKARKLIEQFNTNESGNQVHTTLESFINTKIILDTMRAWGKTRCLGKLLYKSLGSVRRGAGFDLWYIVRNDWCRSLYGTEAMANHLMLNCFEAAFMTAPRQRVGVYLQENLAWEFGLIAAWRQYGHRKLVGVPHTVIRFWDLRYYFDPRSYEQKDKLGLPWPDQIAVNGPVAKEMLLESGCPHAQIVEVEALRYLHLLNRESHRPRVAKKAKSLLLVIGDSVQRNTIRQMRLLEESFIAGGLSNVEIVVKPHPAYTISANDFPNIDFVVIEDSLSQLLSYCDIAYASSVTSGAVDAYLSGVPVISVLDENTLNLSPLRGLPDVHFISKPEALEYAIHKILAEDRRRNGKAAYFNLDSSLSQWMRLLRYG